MNDITDYNKMQQDDDFFENVQDLALDFGDRIKQARESHGYERKELSNLLNVKHSRLKSIENEKMQPDMELQKQLEQTLNIDLSVDEFMN